MKTVLVVILSFSALFVKAVEPSNSPKLCDVLYASSIVGIIGFWVYDYVNAKHTGIYNDECVFTGFGLDPKMMYHDNAGDLFFVVGYESCRFVYYVFVEWFDAIDFKCNSFSVDYRLVPKKMSLLIGGELNNIMRDYGSFYGLGVSLSSRYNISNKLYVSLRANAETAPDISKPWRFNNTIFIVKKF